MNRRQKAAILLGVVLVVSMGLYPPWIYTFDVEGIRMEVSAGYSFITSPPGAPPEARRLSHLWSRRVNIVLLLVQWFGVIIVVGGMLLVLADRKPGPRSGQ